MAVVPRAAATVVLLRDGRDGPEAYLQLRPARMGFAGGLLVFPGGRVDGADGDPAVVDPCPLCDGSGVVSSTGAPAV